MKTLFITLLTLAFLAGSVPAKAQNPEELNRISKMILQAKPEAEILKTWESLVRRYPKMDVNKTITAILATAKQENDKNKSSSTYAATTNLITGLQKKMHEDAKRILANLKS